MKTYYINYGTGAGNLTIRAASLENAMKRADKGIAYSQASVWIYEGDKEVAVRPWVDVDDGDHKEQSDPIRYVGLGYYADWQEVS